MSAQVFVVTVENNVVTQIEPANLDIVPSDVVLDDPLAVSTLLADNNKTNGCMDGEYFLNDFESARHFAALCIGFQKSLCEKSLEAILDVGRDGKESWSNPFVPDALHNSDR